MAAMSSEAATRPTSPNQARAALPSRPGRFLPTCSIAGCDLEACGWVDAVQYPDHQADEHGRVWLCEGDWMRVVDGKRERGVQAVLFP